MRIVKSEYFKITADKYLFQNIFLKDNHVYLMCPLYNTACYQKSDHITITHRSRNLILKKKIINQKGKINRTQTMMMILIYQLESNNSRFTITSLDVKVKYPGIEAKKFHLEDEPRIKGKLALSTLFMDDYRILPLFLNYYRKQGVDHFFLYYNKSIEKNDEVLKYLKDHEDRVTLIEWNFKYWNYGINERPKNIFFRHGAQPCQLHDSIYRYGKNNFEYMIFCDLDEYLYVPGKTLRNLCSSKHPSGLSMKKYDTFSFYNYWSQTDDTSFNPEKSSKLPNSLNYLKHDDARRNKCMHRLKSIETIFVHYACKYMIKNPEIYNYYYMFHFYNWSNKTRNKNNLNKAIYLQPPSRKEINIQKFLFDNFVKPQKEVIYIPSSGNAGDSLIVRGTFDIFKEIKLKYRIGSLSEKYKNKQLIFAGGGILIDKYKNAREFFENNQNNNQILILPHTIYKVNNFVRNLSSNVRVICREETSYNYVSTLIQHKNNVFLSHDMAFYIRDIGKYVTRKPSKKECFCYRTDGEKTDIKLPKNNIDISLSFNLKDNTSDPELIQKSCCSIFDYLSKYKIINTNRLHVAVAGSLLNQRVNFYSNSYHKNKSVFQYSLKSRFPNTVWKS